MNMRLISAAGHLCLLVSLIGVTLAVPAVAQDAQEKGMSSMPGMEMPGMQMPGMKMQGKKKAAPRKKQQVHQPAPPTKQRPKQQAGKSALQGNQEVAPSTKQPASKPLSVSSMQGGNAPPNARSADYSDGYRYGAMPGMDMADDVSLGMVMLDQLEYAHSSHGNSVFLDGEAWYGKDFDKLWLKTEGESTRGRLRDLRTEGLWDHVITTYWSTQLGVRHDFGVGPDRTWAALGVQGLAPYWFDAEATIYVGQGGRTAARLQFQYEELLTQRWVLQPKIELNLSGRDDPQRGTGSGLSDAEFGLRLRYEIRREIAPYVGIVYRQRYGHAADFAHAQGEAPDDVQFVLGLHAWF